MSNTIMTAKNTFADGLVMDFSPDNTQSTSLTSALNATLLTFNGNEMCLQNDMGNGRVETAYLPEGYVPLGTCEFGDIIYVVSYNPLTNKSQIGCFPSPERNIDSNEVGALSNIIASNAFNDVNNGNIKSTRIKIELSNTKLSPGDKYIIYGSELNSNLSYFGDTTHSFSPNNMGLVTLRVASIDDDNKITYLDSDLKWYDNNYYIKSGVATSNTFNDIDKQRNLISSPYNIFGSKTSGKLCIIAELVTIDSFSCTWDVEVYQGEGEQKTARLSFYTNWQSQNAKINPSYAILKINNSNQYYSEYNNLPDRVNDGNDKDEILESIGYNYSSSDDLANTYIYYSVIPAMKVGQLPWLETKGSINLLDIGSGKIELNEWRYHVNDDSFILSWGLDAYPEKNKRISQITMKFIPHDGNSENITTYKIPEKISYSGNFQESIPFENTSYKLNNQLYKDQLYLVEISIEYGNDSQKTNKYFYRWVYTNQMWNDKYLQDIKDFNTLQPELELSGQFKLDKFLSYSNEVVTSNIGTEESQSLSDTLSYNKYKVLKESNNLKVHINGGFKEDYDMFYIDDKYISFSNSLGKSSISTSALSYVSEGSLQAEQQFLEPILDTLQEGQSYLSKRGEDNEELIDTFDIVTGNNFSNTNDFYLTCHGVTYNRATYYDAPTTLTYSSIVAPIIYNSSTLLANNMTFEQSGSYIRFLFNHYLYFGPADKNSDGEGPRMDSGEAILEGTTIQGNTVSRNNTKFDNTWKDFSYFNQSLQIILKTQVDQAGISGSIIPYIFAHHWSSADQHGIYAEPSYNTNWIFKLSSGSTLISNQYRCIDTVQNIGPNFVGGIFIKGSNSDTLYPLNFFYTFSSSGGQALSKTGTYFKGSTAADAIVDILSQLYVVHDTEGSRNLYIPDQLNYLSPYLEYWNKEIITNLNLNPDNYSQIQIKSIKIQNILSNVSRYVSQSSDININNISPTVKPSQFTNNVSISVQNNNNTLLITLKRFDTNQGNLIYTNQGTTYIDTQTSFNRGIIYYRNINNNTFSSSNKYVYKVLSRQLTEQDLIKLNFEGSSGSYTALPSSVTPSFSTYYQYNRITGQFEVIPTKYSKGSKHIKIDAESSRDDQFIRELGVNTYLNSDFKLF